MLICQLTDLHVRPRGLPAVRVIETNMLAERAFRAVAAMRPAPDAVLLTGDLTEFGLAAEYACLAEMLRDHLTMPVYAIPGNHDKRREMRAGLAHLPGVTSDPAFIQYTVEDLPVRLVMLDTAVPNAGHGALSAGQLDWLDRALAAVPDKPTMIAMHHPPFACGIVHMDRINLRDAAGFIDVVRKHRQVERIVCGHNHRPVIARVGHAIASIAPSVAHQAELTFDPVRRAHFLMEPPAFHAHCRTEADGIVTHTVYVDQYPGPYPWL